MSLEKFKQSNDRFYFEKLFKELPNAEDHIPFFVAQCVAGISYFRKMDMEVFRLWQSRIQRLRYIFEQDCRKLASTVGFESLLSFNNGKCPIFDAYRNNLIEMETIVVFDVLIGFCQDIVDSGVYDPFGKSVEFAQFVLLYKRFIADAVIQLKLAQVILDVFSEA